MSFKQDIYREDGVLYLVRYKLLSLPFIKIRIHHILISDNDCLHDHPWDFFSCILKGGYWEHYDQIELQYPEGKKVFRKSKWYGRGSILFRKAEWIHRLELPHGKSKDNYRCIPAWTLVIHFKTRRQWGFWVKQKFVYWRNYTSQSKCD